MSECAENLQHEESFAYGDCRHSEALKELKCEIRMITHDLSQPITLLQGYLELLELEKFNLDSEGLQQHLDIFSKQANTFQKIQTRLRVLIAPDIKYIK